LKILENTSFWAPSKNTRISYVTTMKILELNMERWVRYKPKFDKKMRNPKKTKTSNVTFAFKKQPKFRFCFLHFILSKAYVNYFHITYKHFLLPFAKWFDPCIILVIVPLTKLIQSLRSYPKSFYKKLLCRIHAKYTKDLT